MIGTTEATIVSWHHQAAHTAPLGGASLAMLRMVVEALEHEHHPWAIAVQWHPTHSMTH